MRAGTYIQNDPRTSEEIDEWIGGEEIASVRHRASQEG
jgi:hypothetical protein